LSIVERQFDTADDLVFLRRGKNNAALLTDLGENLTPRSPDAVDICHEGLSAI
jgi:hypothetical protein